MAYSYDEFQHGTLVRVLGTAHGGRELYLRFRNGNETRLSGDKNDIEAGDVLLLAQDAKTFEKVPKRVWQEPSTVYVVKSVLPGKLVVEIGGLIRVIPFSENVTVEAGNTIEFDDVSNTAELLSEHPIRAHDLIQNETDDASRFEEDLSDSEISFDSFGGYASVVERAREILQLQLDQQDAIREIGARPVRGVMFTGPPGTGKTLLAKIVAKESGAKFYVISGPQIVSEYVGASERSLRHIFEAAAKQPKAIIFFDEIDSVASKRSEDSHEASVRLVSQLLTLMDGVNEQGGNVVVVAATNRIEEIDPALRRPGRFDWEISFDYPSIGERIQILERTSLSLQIEEELPFELVAQLTGGWSGADLSAIWTEAMILALGEKRRRIAAEDLILGLERTSKRRLEEERK